MVVEPYLNLHQKVDITVWRESDDEGFSFPSYIKDLKPYRFLVEPPGASASHLLSLLQPGYLVGVVLLSPDQNPVLFYPRIQQYQETGLVGYWLSYTSETQVEVIQRRQHARVSITLPILGQVLLEEERLLSFEGLSLNLSAGGLRFVSAHRFDLHQELQLSWRFSDELPSGAAPPLQSAASPLFSIKGRVVLSQLNPAPPSTVGARAAMGRYLTSVQFLQVSEAQEAQITRECFRRELKARRISPNT